MRVLSIRQFSSRLKASIQSSGRLNFTEETTKTLGLKEGTPIKFAVDDEKDNVLFLALVGDKDEDAFRVRKSGTYCYVPTKNLFDALGLDYAGKSIGFDLVRAQDKDGELGGMTFKMRMKATKSGGEKDVND